MGIACEFIVRLTFYDTQPMNRLNWNQSNRTIQLKCPTIEETLWNQTSNKEIMWIWCKSLSICVLLFIWSFHPWRHVHQHNSRRKFAIQLYIFCPIADFIFLNSIPILSRMHCLHVPLTSMSALRPFFHFLNSLPCDIRFFLFCSPNL